MAETKDHCLKNKVKRERTLKIILRFPPKGCGARALPHVTIRKRKKGRKGRDSAFPPTEYMVPSSEIKGHGKLAFPSETQPAASGHLWWQAKLYHPEALVSRISLCSLPITHSNFSYPETKHCSTVVQSLGEPGAMALVVEKQGLAFETCLKHKPLENVTHMIHVLG